VRTIRAIIGTALLAVALLVGPLPLHALALPRRWTPVAHARPHHGPPAEVRTAGFLLLSTALTLTAFALYAASLALIPLLTGRGLSHGMAATAFGLLGAGQLLGRLGYAPLSARTTSGTRTVVLVAAAAVPIALLAALPAPAALLVALAVTVGAVRGAGTLLQATVVADRWGTAQYGTLSGWFSAPITSAIALAPWAGTALAGLSGGFPALFWELAALAVVATGVAALSLRRPAPVEI